jgi:hypothetical protein
MTDESQGFVRVGRSQIFHVGLTHHVSKEKRARK